MHRGLHQSSSQVHPASSYAWNLSTIHLLWAHNPTTVKDLKRILANVSLWPAGTVGPIFHPEKCQCSAAPNHCVLSPATQGWVHGTLPSPWRTDGPTKLRNLEFTSCQTTALWLKMERLHNTAKLFFSLRSTP
jgi:hypothetical protein